MTDNIKHFQMDSLKTLEKYASDMKNSGEIDILKMKDIQEELKRRWEKENLSHYKGQQTGTPDCLDTSEIRQLLFREAKKKYIQPKRGNCQYI